MKKIITIIIILILSMGLVSAFNYPVIVSGQGYNHTEVKQLVYSIPIKYLVHVDRIEFIERPQLILGGFMMISTTVREGYIQTDFYPQTGKCDNVRITLHNPDTIFHELGHGYDICVLGNPDSTEKFADDMGEIIRSEVKVKK